MNVHAITVVVSIMRKVKFVRPLSNAEPNSTNQHVHAFGARVYIMWVHTHFIILIVFSLCSKFIYNIRHGGKFGSIPVASDGDKLTLRVARSCHR